METQTPEQMFAEANAAKQSIVDAHEKKKSEEQEKMISDFKKQLMLTRKPNTDNNKPRKDFNKIFNDARNYCLNVLVECSCMPVEEICRVFSTDGFEIDPYHPGGTVSPKYPSYYWFNFLKGDKNDIPLPYDMEKPKRRDKKTGKMVDLNFFISRFYSDSEYLKMCNDYYSKFNLEFHVTNQKRPDGRNSFKWKLHLVINKSGFINLVPQFDQLEYVNEVNEVNEVEEVVEE